MSTDPRIEAAAKALGERIDMHLPSAFDDGCLAHDGSHCEDDGDCIQDMATTALAAADKAATITDWHALEAMPVLSSILHGGYIWEKAGPGSWESVDGYVRHSIDLTPAYVRRWGTE